MLAAFFSTVAWMPSSGVPPARRPRLPTVVAPTCCICINCKFVDQCKTYRWVEDMHEQPHVAQNPEFEPNDPQIQVFIRDEDTLAASPVPAEVSTAAEGSSQGVDEASGRREWRSTHELTIEYDVFACDAFTEDKGRWLRLMPDADFIPT